MTRAGTRSSMACSESASTRADRGRHTPTGLREPMQAACRYWPSTFRADSTRTPASHSARTIRAAATATFIALKPGLLTGDGPDHCGTISVHALGLDVEATAARARRAADAGNRCAMPCQCHCDAHAATTTREASERSRSSAAATGMVGAALLAGRAACMSAPAKCGSVSCDRPAARRLRWQPELMLDSPQRVLGMPCDALVIGPGLGSHAQRTPCSHPRWRPLRRW